jgi:predicted DNA binding CopG/RHH family protein
MVQKQFLKGPRLSTEETLQFIEDYKKIVFESTQDTSSQAISLRVPKSLLSAFKTHCKANGISYQKKIKDLMREFLTNKTSI